MIRRLNSIPGAALTRNLAAAVLLACGAPAARAAEQPAAGSLVVRLDGAEYALGDTAHVFTHNMTTSLALFSATCDLELEVRIGDEWSPYWQPDCSRIRVIPSRLAPGDSLQFPVALPPETSPAPPDSLSLRVTLRWQGPDGTVAVAASSEFRVIVQ